MEAGVRTVERAVMLRAARGGDLTALMTVLDPDVTLRGDGGMRVLRGADTVAGQLATFQRMATIATTRPALVNTMDGELISIMSFTIANEKIVEIDILSDPNRLSRG